ncbi:facilitated trehalose transporter Tret1-like [Epargyreus clarus]|uniref:facilitated trehalose transporter Tret1-like n=1 Tax=Epargyreus clarus TaxID=520877 RepID=UPI003C2F1902
MGKIHQVQTAVAASFGPVLTGLLFVWPSYTTSIYTHKNTTVLSAPMTDVEVSLFGCLPPLGAMLGTVLAGMIMNTFGRHKGGLILALPYLLSWIMIDWTSSSIVILIARFISGISCGGFLVYAPIFISEVAEESIRGTLATGPVAFNCLGILLSYIFGWFLSYKYIIWANIVCCCIGLGLIIMVTESPVWLMRQNREEDARRAIAHYRGLSTESKIVLDEISRLKAQIDPVELVSINDGSIKAEEAEKEKLNVDENVTKSPEKISPLKTLFISPSSRRAFTVTGLTLTCQVMMGIIAVQVFAQDIFSEAAPTVSSHFCSVVFASVLLIGSVISALFSDKFGRRILLLLSAVGVVLCLFCMGLLLQTNLLPPWVTAIIILVYCFAFMFGAGSVPYVLLAEAFVPEVHGVASMLLMEWVWLLNFVLLGIFPFLVKYFGIQGAFYCFAIFGILDILVGIFLLPETKGLTNDQIQDAFLRRRRI